VVDETFLLWEKPQKLIIKRKMSMRSFFIWGCLEVLNGLVKILITNGLSVGEYPEGFAYTLLWVSFKE